MRNFESFLKRGEVKKIERIKKVFPLLKEKLDKLFISLKAEK